MPALFKQVVVLFVKDVKFVINMKQIIAIFVLSLGMNSIAQQLTFEDPFRYLALGDSYTIGQSVPVEERFPVQLLERLKSTYGLRDAEVDIIAQTGWTTTSLKAAIELFLDESVEYDLVSLLIGVNNQYQGMDINTYRPAFSELLERAISIAGGDKNKVFVVSIPDYAFTPSHANIAAISDEIDDYNNINRNVSMEYGVRYVNITPISRRGLDEPDLVASDDLHPSGKQYSEWVVEIANELAKALATGDDSEDITDLKTGEPGDSLLWNLSKGSLHLDLPEAGGLLSLYDIQGRLVNEVPAMSKKMSVEVNDLLAGIYLLQYEVNNKKISRKVFID